MDQVNVEIETALQEARELIGTFGARCAALRGKLAVAQQQLVQLAAENEELRKNQRKPRVKPKE